MPRGILRTPSEDASERNAAYEAGSSPGSRNATAGVPYRGFPHVSAVSPFWGTIGLLHRAVPRRLRGALQGMALCGLMAPAAVAAAPIVAFDVGQAVACRDVTTPSFADANSDEKIVEAIFRVSVLLKEGDQEDIEELIVAVVSPERRARILDFAPKTRMATDVVGEVEVVDSRDVESSLSASIGGQAAAQYGVVELGASPSMGLGTVRRHESKETFKRLPPKQTVIASGTTHAEHGVFFKFKPSPQDSIEGMRPFTCRWVVPADWRGDWVIVSCRARAASRNLLSSQPKPCGHKQVRVGLYLEGDAGAKRLALSLSHGSAARRLAALRSAPRGRTSWRVALKPVRRGVSSDRTTPDREGHDPWQPVLEALSRLGGRAETTWAGN